MTIVFSNMPSPFGNKIMPDDRWVSFQIDAIDSIKIFNKKDLNKIYNDL